MSMTEFGYAQSPDLLKAWKQAGDITEVPRIDNSAAHTTNIGQSYSTRWLTSSDYLNLRSVTIGYQLPKTWLSKVMLKSARQTVKQTKFKSNIRRYLCFPFQ
jgi:hypothetical protein